MFHLNYELTFLAKGYPVAFRLIEIRSL